MESDSPRFHYSGAHVPRLATDLCKVGGWVRFPSFPLKTDNAFCSAVEQAVGKPLVTGSNPVCANRKSIRRVEISRVSFAYGSVAKWI